MASKETPYFRSDLKARMTLNGASYPVAQIGINYRLNNVPHAEITIPLGKKGTGGGSFVNGPVALLNNLKPFALMEIFLETRGTQQSPKAGMLPNGEVKVFSGFVSTPTFQRTNDRSGLTFQAYGYLGALDSVTRIVEGLAYAAPINGQRLLNTRLAGKQAFTSQAALAGLNIRNDLWLGFRTIITEAIRAGAAFRTSAENGSDTELALNALDRINTGAVLPEGVLRLPVIEGADPDILNQNLANTLVQGFLSAWSSPESQAGMYSVLRGLSSQFLYHITSAVEEDGVLPICPTLDGGAWRVIDPSEQFEFNVMARERAETDEWYNYYTQVVVTEGGDWRASPYDDGSICQPSIGYAKASPDGKIRAIEAPAWLRKPPIPFAKVYRAGSPLPDASNPGNFGVVVSAQDVEEAILTSGLGDRFAQAYLSNLLFAHRQLGMLGPLRLDIAPGSLVQINTPGERFLGGADTVYGCASGVTLELANTSGGCYARTAISVSHLRAPAEHEDVNVTVPGHPLFGARWVGGPLVKL